MYHKFCPITENILCNLKIKIKGNKSLCSVTNDCKVLSYFLLKQTFQTIIAYFIFLNLLPTHCILYLKIKKKSKT